MKLHHLMIVAVLTLTVFSGESIAQERLFGNGRMLKRFRDSLTGNRFSDGAKSKSTVKSTAKATAKTKSKAPTPAKKPTTPNYKSKVPTPAKKANKQPTLAPPRKPVAPAFNNRDVPPIVSPNNQREARVTRSGKKQTIGFGMLLENKSGDFVVTQINPKGNAAKSGLKVGDEVFKAAGIKIQSIEEFNQITDVLREGDQIEVEYRRRDKKDKSLIMLGEGPELEEQTVELIEPANVVDSSNKESLLKAPSDFEFVPPQANRSPSVVQRAPGNFRPSPSNQVRSQQPVQKSAERLQYEQALEQQRREIEQLNAELRRLRTTPIVPANTETQGNSILQVPDLNGPRR